MQVLIDGTSQEYSLMRDTSTLSTWLRECAKRIGMTPFGDPVVRAFAWPGSEDESALSGYCFLQESGIQVHTYPEARTVFVDVFSCKDFNSVLLTNFVRQTWAMDFEPDVIVLQRGIEHKARLKTRVREPAPRMDSKR